MRWMADDLAAAWREGGLSRVVLVAGTVALVAWTVVLVGFL